MSKEKRLNFNDILAEFSAEKEHRVYVKELGGYIPYKDLTLEDFSEITKKRDDAIEMSKLALYKAWHKADPTVTLEGIEKIPARIILKIVSKISPTLFGTAPLETLPVLRQAESSIS